MNSEYQTPHPDPHVCLWTDERAVEQMDERLTGKLTDR